MNLPCWFPTKNPTVFRLTALVLLLFSGSAAAFSSNQTGSSVITVRSVTPDFPLLFQENHGQAPSQARYVVHGKDFFLLLAESEIVWSLARPADSEISSRGTDTIRMSCLGMNPEVRMVPESPALTRTHYLIGSDPARWKRNLPNHRRVRYQGIYPGIDLVFYGRGQQLEYDFIVSPGSDPRQIQLRFSGAGGISMSSGGELIVRATHGEMHNLAPRVYQQIGEKVTELPGAYKTDESGLVTFEIGDYDQSIPLIIDPVLVFSTYLGGSAGDVPGGIAADSGGNVYVTGSTGSMDFPVLNPVQGQFAGGGTPLGDIFVTKLAPLGTEILYSTYVGGTGTDIAGGIDVDSTGQVYVGGTTFSRDFPATPGAFQQQCTTECPFVFKLSADGSQLLYSTFIGRGAGEGIAVDSLGQAAITGRTTEEAFPVRSAFQSQRGGMSDAFVSKLNAQGNDLVFSTFLGGSGNENLSGKRDIATDSNGNVYVTGRTNSDNFPLRNAIQSARGGGEDVFVAKFTPQGDLTYSTLLGGSANEGGHGIAADSVGNTYVVGETRSANFPTANAFQATFGGAVGTGDAFLAKISPAGTSLLFSTFFGGPGGDSGSAVAVDAMNRPVIVGSASATGFPALNAIRAFEGIDNFVAKFSADGAELLYSTSLSAGDADIYVDTFNNEVVVAGNISAGDIPILKALKPRSQGSTETFLAQISDSARLTFAQMGNGVGVVSELLLTNSSVVTESNASVVFLGDDGLPLALDVTVSDTNSTLIAPQGAMSQIDVVVPPLGLVRIATDGSGPIVSGSATVTFDSPIGGVIRFNLNPFGTAGVGASELVRGFITPVRRSAINTGIAVHNPENRQVGLRLQLRNTAGVQISGGLRNLALPAGGHQARFINELFPNAQLNNFVGTLTVEVTTSNAVIAATALELGTEPGQFTTLPVTPLP